MRKNKLIIYISFCFLVILTILTACKFNVTDTNADADTNKPDIPALPEVPEEPVRPTYDYVYLSDLNYLEDNKLSYTTYGEITKDKNIENNLMSLNINNNREYFYKGIASHAKSQIVYDISEYNTNYSVFDCYLGVDFSRNGNGDVSFKISASNDLKEFIILDEVNSINSSDEAYHVRIDVTNYKYLILFTDTNGVNHSDHSIFADARLLNKNYDLNNDKYSKLKTIEEYDQIISKQPLEYTYNNNIDIVLKRELLNRLNILSIDRFVRSNKDIKDIFDYLIGDVDALELLIESGETRNYHQTILNLALLYKNYKNILNDKTNGYQYKKMMIGLAVTYGSDFLASPLKFSSGRATYDIVRRFGLYKYLYDNNLFVRKDEFKNYHMELVRLVMNSSLSNEDFLWLRKYSELKVENLNDRLNPYTFMAYKEPIYNKDEFFDPKNEEFYDSKYHLSEFNVKYDNPSREVKYWMSLEAGGYCFNISRLGQDLNTIHGIPSVGIYQSGHEAFFTYSLDEKGNGVWALQNDVAGWQGSYNTWYRGNQYRMLLNWANLDIALGKDSSGNVNYSSTYNANYLLVAQEALNNYKSYKKSYYYNLMANSFKTDEEKLNVYEKALNELNSNVLVLNNILSLYNKLEKTSSEYKKLAEKVINAFTYHPAVLVDFINEILPRLDELDHLYITNLKSEALIKASKCTKNDYIQDNICRNVASSFLKNEKIDLASFSFNDNSIKINEYYKGFNIRIAYSLDNGKTYKETFNHKILLTKEELALINTNDDILVRIVGANVDYKIDIKEYKNIDLNKFSVNDLENRFMGDTNYLEYSFDNINFNDYLEDTRFKDNVSVYVRYKAHDSFISSKTELFNFNLDNETYKYINVSDISLVSTGTTSQPGEEAIHMIDGSIYTKYHTSWNKTATDKSFIVKFNEIKKLKEIRYIPAAGNGRIRDVEIYVSNDNVTYNKVGEALNLANNTETKVITLDNSYDALYVKILPTYTYGNTAPEHNRYVSGKRFDFFSI